MEATQKKNSQLVDTNRELETTTTPHAHANTNINIDNIATSSPSTSTPTISTPVLADGSSSSSSTRPDQIQLLPPQSHEERHRRDSVPMLLDVQTIIKKVLKTSTETRRRGSRRRMPTTRNGVLLRMRTKTQVSKGCQKQQKGPSHPHPQATGRHPSYSRFHQQFQAIRALRRAQALSEVLQHTLRDLTRPQYQSPFIKSPAYIRQRLAADYPPPPSPPQHCPTSYSFSPSNPSSDNNGNGVLSATQPTTIALEDKERLKAFYESLPKEMAQELSMMIERHVARVPSDAKVSLVLRPLPEHMQVQGKRKFEVNLKYTKPNSSSSSSSIASTPTASSSSTTPTPPTASPSFAAAATAASSHSSSSPCSPLVTTNPSLKRRREEIDSQTSTSTTTTTTTTTASLPSKRNDKSSSTTEFQLDSKFLLWPKESVIQLLRRELFPKLARSTVENMISQAFQRRHSAFDSQSNLQHPRWPYRSIRQRLQGLNLRSNLQTTTSVSILSISDELRNSFLRDGDPDASAPEITLEMVEARWNAFIALESGLLPSSNSSSPSPSSSSAAQKTVVFVRRLLLLPSSLNNTSKA